MNIRLCFSITLNCALCGFGHGWGAGIFTLEEKLAQQLAGIFHKIILQVFLDMQNAYESLDHNTPKTVVVN